MGSNPSPSLVVRTGRAPKYRACWEVPTSEKDMVQVDHLLEEIANLSAFMLTRAAVALSYCKQLVQQIQDRVHPDYEYWGRVDPTQWQNRMVPQEEAETGSPA